MDPLPLEDSIGKSMREITLIDSLPKMIVKSFGFGIILTVQSRSIVKIEDIILHGSRRQNRAKPKRNRWSRDVKD